MIARIQASTRFGTGEKDEWFSARAGENQRRVYLIAFSVLRNDADAEEVAQDVLLKAYRNLWRLRDAAKFRQWVCRIAFRAALNQRRRRLRQLERDTAWHGRRSQAEAGAACEAHGSLLLDRLRDKIDTLPEKLRAVLLLCAVEEMDAGEVAAILRIPAGTVRSRLHLARKRLLEAMEQ